MAYLDRMFAVSSLHLQWGEQRCNIITVASLKLAIKLFEPRALNLDDMVKLATKMGGGFYTPRAIIEMEQEMLWKFAWDVFPPTAFCFAHHMICMLPDEVPTAPTKYLIQELAKYQSELAVCKWINTLQLVCVPGYPSRLRPLLPTRRIPVCQVQAILRLVCVLPGCDS